VRITCRTCAQETLIEQPMFACAYCGSTSIEITGGREMHLKEVIATQAVRPSKNGKMAPSALGGGTDGERRKKKTK
jgi:ribosomal protein S27E